MFSNQSAPDTAPQPTMPARPMKSVPPMTLSLVIAGSALLVGCSPLPSQNRHAALAKSLTLHASFDASADADFALGDRRIQTMPKMSHPRVVQPGLPPGNVVHLDPTQGRYGGALRFERKVDDVIAFRGANNIAYSPNHWSGTVSFWLRLTPEVDLAPGYCDTIQITPRDWNDAALFTEFTDKNPRDFRLGSYADLKVWNPNNRDWDKIPLAEKPLVPISNYPFSRDRWTHVVFTWDNYNTGQPNGTTRLYLDGQFRGEMPPSNQKFTWDTEKCLIMLGLSYVGWMDDVALFNRSLSAAEVTELHQLPGGVGPLVKSSR